MGPCGDLEVGMTELAADEDEWQSRRQHQACRGLPQHRRNTPGTARSAFSTRRGEAQTASGLQLSRWLDTRSLACHRHSR
jgi:hypothetical protein